MSQSIAIVGAGIAGLAAACKLRAAGLDCTLFEKSRGLGGRMATRRAGEWQFDHGAQYFTARGPRFRTLAESWRANGHAEAWPGGGLVGLPGMTGPARAMACGLPLVAGQAVVALRRGSAGWTLSAADGPIETPDNGRFDAVLLALPSPQILPLVESAGGDFPELAAARYAPCWTLMLGFSSQWSLRADSQRPDDGVVAWLARDSAKPGRRQAGDTFVLQATAAWSRRNLERASDAVAEELLTRFQSLSGARVTPDFLTAHRWRYALVERAAETPCLWDRALRLGACGDWCLGPRVEAAFDSGEAMADAVLRG
jgi:renalase